MDGPAGPWFPPSSRLHSSVMPDPSARVAKTCIIVWSLTQNDQHAVGVAMKYVLLGNLSPEWANKQSDRVGKAKAKLDKLGIKIESIPYTQGQSDFLHILDDPNPEAMLACSVWYATQGL